MSRSLSGTQGEAREQLVQSCRHESLGAVAGFRALRLSNEAEDGGREPLLQSAGGRREALATLKGL